MSKIERYRYDIKCDYCGKFVKASEICEGGGGSRGFVPDSEVTREEHVFRCKKCTESHGKVQTYQMINQDVCTWIC